MLVIQFIFLQVVSWRESKPSSGHGIFHNSLLSHKHVAVSLLAGTFWLSTCSNGYASEYFGDTSSSVGSIDFNIFRSQSSIDDSRPQIMKKLREAEKLSMKEDGEINEVEKILNFIPSWKYYKIISNEYSKRSAGYNGEANLLAPLL